MGQLDTEENRGRGKQGNLVLGEWNLTFRGAKGERALSLIPQRILAFQFAAVYMGECGGVGVSVGVWVGRLTTCGGDPVRAGRGGAVWGIQSGCVYKGLDVAAPLVGP